MGELQVYLQYPLTYESIALFAFKEFENAVRKAISSVTFDRDIVVSLFETNIRVLG